MKMAAIYTRVSSEQQREERTIASQTAALCEFARSHDLEVPEEWVFEDAGYSGATLERPGLERVRDLAAEGQIQAVLAYAPDRLSRKYAYQVLLIEEFARHGIETLFVKAPQGTSAEDQLLVQFQGMIAEYERAQILERSRRGKRHRARSGEVSVLSGAPYGYRYIRKTDEAPASYLVMDAEARVVQRVYEMYTVEGLSMGEITRRLNAEGIPTRKQSTRWERSVVWAWLAQSCLSRSSRVWQDARRRPNSRHTSTASTRWNRLQQQYRARASAKGVVEIPVPALVSEESFARAQELLHENKIRSQRRTITPSVVQGLVSCQKCGYAFSRTSTYTAARKLHYYKCIGSDRWRKLGGPVCDNRMVRQDLLDQIVWAEVIRFCVRGVISVLLSNLYLHHVLDLWFERVVKPRLRGEAYLIRYMDDFVICLQYREDAERVSEVLRKRLEKFALALEPSKTKLIEFGRFAERDARARGQRPATLYFLGFTHYCTRNRKGNFKVGRKTERSRLRRTLACLQELMREIRHEPVKDQVTTLNQVLRGHYAYYGVAGNLPSLRKVHRAVERYWHKMLCSRSWKSYMPWEVFVKVKTCFPLLRPRPFLPYAPLKSCAVL